MTVSTVGARTGSRAAVPSPRRAPRHHAAVAAIGAALEESGCILVGVTATDAGCVVGFYDARSLGRAQEVIVAAAKRNDDLDLVDRARQSGTGAWKVTAAPQAWRGPDGDPRGAGVRSSTTWHLDIPLDDLVPVASALMC
ncbi:hypothetical protein GTR02_16750 [Kineococcus sp. R8]|uniref:hypothetical protein n=1 Tax=Kineococcus siccus TaxID=2696567 RepID=UPI001411E298|nr:hypothetical protein [Kineococcus siccus]NAZ83468.1 hypothetical protein [Kineococcus siccus]